MGKGVEDANTYRVGHPLAQRVLERGKALIPPPAMVTFDQSDSGKNLATRSRCVARAAGSPAHGSR